MEENQAGSAHTPSPMSNKGIKEGNSVPKKSPFMSIRRKQREGHSLFLDESPLMGADGVNGQHEEHEEHEVKQVVDLYSLKCLFQDIGCHTNLNDLYRFVSLIVTMNMIMVVIV